MKNENRMVWSSDVMSFLCNRCKELYSDDDCDPNDCLMLEELGKCKTVDATEVVRCDACKYWRENWISGVKSGVCIFRKAIRTRPDDFCSYGERRNNE